MIEGCPPVHPAAEKFPMMSSGELDALAQDIKDNGQRVPIDMLAGAILDGRNRWEACRRAAVEPITREWNGQGSPTAYVLSINLKRRHLTPEQRAALAAEFEGLFAEEARARMLAGKANPPVETTGGSRQDREALAQAAKAAGASYDSAKKLKSAAKADPELLTMAREGKVKVSQAKALAEMEPEERNEAKERIKAGEKPATVIHPPPRLSTKPPEKFMRVLYPFDEQTETDRIRSIVAGWPKDCHDSLRNLLNEILKEIA